MRGLGIWLGSVLVVSLVAFAGCSKGVEEAGCKSNADCSGTLKSCVTDKGSPNFGVCVECVSQADCAQGSFCDGSNTCKTQPCTNDQECSSLPNAPRCDSKNSRCVQCLTRNDCNDASEACVLNACVPACDHCRENEVCYAGSACIPKTVDCTANPSACPGNETCVSVSEEKAFCFLRCDTAKSDETGLNPDCWDSYGKCQNVSDQAICLPPAGQNGALGDHCLDISDLTAPTYQDCTPGLICADPAGHGVNTCSKACDATKMPSASSPECGGKACVHVDPSDDKKGACDDRKHTQGQGKQCETGEDPVLPEFQRCQSDANLTCKLVNDIVKMCVKDCGAIGGGTCDDNYECSDPDSGVCLPTHKRTQASGQRCFGQDPTSATWNDCADRLIPCLDGTCGPVRTQTRSVNETCELMDPADASYNTCTADSTCYFKCVKNCTLATPTECGGDETCYDPMDGTGNGWCLKKCDPASGFSTNTTCVAGLSCYPVAKAIYATAGACMPLPNPVAGTAGAGEACDNVKIFCDATAGLFCGTGGGANGTCMKACDPRAGGTTNNALCGAGNECVEEYYSYLGGKCLPAATKTAGQACDDSANRCVSGFFCAPDGKCAKACHVYNQTPATNADCAVGQFCVAEPLVREGGFCKALPNPETGTKTLGQACIRGECNGATGLYCENGFCEKACDPREGLASNPGCAGGQECAEDAAASFKGGACMVTPTQNVNETCDARTSRCVSGLTCVKFSDALNLCKAKCDPAVHAAVCPANNECVATDATATGGACVEQHLKTRQENESCLVLDDPRDPGWNDCATANLSCDPAGHTCLAGVPLYGDCSTDQCVPVYLCVNTGAAVLCLDKCPIDPNNPASDCGNGWYCANAGGQGVCTQICTTPADCKAYGTQCADPAGFGVSICL